MNPSGEDTVLSAADLHTSSSTEETHLQQHPAEEIASGPVVVKKEDRSSQGGTEEKAAEQSLPQSDEQIKPDQIKRCLELIGMKEMIELMETKQAKLEAEIVKLNAQNETYQAEIRSLNEKLNNAMAAKIDSKDELARYRNLPIMKMSTKCWARAAWFKIYEDKMATNDKRILKTCLMYYLSDEFQSRSFLEHFSHRNYDDLKFMFLKSEEF